MNLGKSLAFSLAIALCGTVGTVKAEETIKVEEKSKDGKHEMKMKVTSRDGRYYGRYNDRDYELRGSNVKFERDGDYYITGDIDAGNTYIETRAYRPIIVEEKRDPFIKVGPVEVR